jgi:hypothetical protein
MSGNLKNFNSKKIELRLSDSDYWDFYLAKDEDINEFNNFDDCLVVHYDFNDNDVFTTGNTSADTIYSLSVWSGATNSGYTLDTIGLTGIDNGLITFTKLSSDTSNNTLLSALTGNTLVIPSGDTRLTLHRVTGMTGNYIYPLSVVIDSGSTGNYVNFCGGFYQGFYKLDGVSYEVLPNRVPKAWVMDFWLKKSDNICETISGKTLNDIYPNNKGIFFYIGTRAENKFWNQFEGLNTGTTSGCTSGSTKWCTIPKEKDISIIDDNSNILIPLNPPQIIIREIKNQFLIYGRASSGSTFCNNSSFSGFGNKLACNWTGDSIFVTSTKKIKTDFRNPFLIYSRSNGKTCSPCGVSATTDPITACNYSGDSIEVTELDWANDVVDNAMAFMIKDDGSIGVRWLTYSATCSGDTTISGCSVQESFSQSGTVKNDIWTKISIRFIMPKLDYCELTYKKPRKGKLMFYVNCKLKHVVDNFDEMVFKRLSEHWKKQIGVPFNISLGGGTQGLLESMTFDGQDPDDLNLCIEENFAGSFIGGISQFKWYICDLNWVSLQKTCNEECSRYDICDDCKKM